MENQKKFRDIPRSRIYIAQVRKKSRHATKIRFKIIEARTVVSARRKLRESGFSILGLVPLLNGRKGDRHRHSAQRAALSFFGNDFYLLERMLERGEELLQKQTAARLR